MKPVAIADRKHLRLQYATQRRDAALDFAKLPAVTFDDGHSLLIDVTDIHSKGPTAAVPVLDKVPGESRLFTNTGKSDRRTLLLITGRVIVLEENEVRAFPIKADLSMAVSD